MSRKSLHLILSIAACLVLAIGLPVLQSAAQDGTPVVVDTPIETEAPVETAAPVETVVPVETVATVEETVAPVETEAPITGAEATVSAAKSPIAVPNAITSITVTPTTLANACDSVSMRVDWAVPDTAGAGSTFTLTLDPRLQVSDDFFFLPSPDPGVNIATASVSGGVVTFTLLSYAETHDNNAGWAEFSSSSCWAQSSAGSDVTLVFSGDIQGGNITQTVTVPEIPTAVPTNTPQPTNTPGPTNTPRPTNTPTNTPTLTPTWDPSIPTFTPTATSTPRPTNTPTNTPTLTPTWDPSIPTNTPVPTNTPAPTPTPVRDAQKSGVFTRNDQGKLNPDKALKWSVEGIQGPFDTLTITDSVPAGSNWAFDCDAGSVNFSPWEGTTFTCSATEVTVTFTNVAAGTWVGVSMLADTKPPFESLQTFANAASWVGNDGSSGTSNTGYLVQTQGGGGGGGGNTPTPIPSLTPTATTAATATETTAPTATATTEATATATATSVPATATATNVPPTATATATATNTPRPAVTPVNPSTTDGSCTGGQWTAPTVTAATTTGITYTVSAIDMGTGAYTVTATLADGYTFGPLPSGWTLQNDGTALHSGTVALNPCTPVVPQAPAVTQGICTGGAVVPPSVVPAMTEGIAYTVEGTIAPGETVTVIATLADGYTFGSLPSGWTDHEDGTASTTVTLDDVECAPVVPVIPVVEGNTCLGGVYTPPAVTVDDTASGLTYTIGAVDMETGAYTVTATLKDGQAWGTLPQGWTRTNGTTATYDGTVDLNVCTPVVPVNPVVVQAVCTGGTLVAPSVTPGTTEGIAYTVEGGVAPGSTVIVKATLADGFSWGTLPTGWVQASDSTATYRVTLDDVACEEVIPAAPIVTNAVCTGGALSDPAVDLQETTGITYTLTGEVVNGGTVTVTAVLADGYAWGELPAGWTKVSDTTASYLVQLDDVECTPVAPEAPAVTNAVCTGGGLTAPSVIPATTEGVVYTLSGEVVNGGTVIVTAALTDGYAWSELPDGWTRVDDATATTTVQLAEVSCTPVVPAIPAVEQGHCSTSGAVIDPTVSVGPAEGIVFAIDGDLVPGGTVVVTATLTDGYAWGELPAGWTRASSTTATYTIVLDAVHCEKPVVPASSAQPTPVKTVAVNALPSTGQGERGADETMMLLALVTLSVTLGAAAIAITRRTKRPTR